MGKSALLERLAESASDFHVIRAVGVEGEADLPYAGLHQLCRSLLDTLSVLPPPQAAALRVALGLASGEASNGYLVGLAVLTLLSEVAAKRPLLCVVDDAQWLDRATIQALGFVSRRLDTDSVGIVIASRESMDELDLPGFRLGGLSLADSRLLLDSVVVGKLEGAVRDRFLVETRGNPLALLELPRALTPAEAATGILRLDGDSLSDRLEEGFGRRLEPLPAETRQLLLLAAIEPVGDLPLLLRAAAQLNLRFEAVEAAEEAGLVEVRERWSFRHPLARSAVYRWATARERRLAHAALATATDAQVDPDRRAWHRAHATSTPNEEVAAELEQTATRAQSRGGLAAAAAFLERAAQLTPDADTRAERALAAAEMLVAAGAFDSAGNLLASTAPQMNGLRAIRGERLRAMVTLAQSENREEQREAVKRLLVAAEKLKQVDPAVGQASYLEALNQGHTLGPDLMTAVAVALEEVPASAEPSPVELLVRGWAQMLHGGYPAGTDLLRSAMIALRDTPDPEESDYPSLVYLLANVGSIARSLWDFESWETITRRAVRLARHAGALSILPKALFESAECRAVAGDFPAAAMLLAEAGAVKEATRQSREDPWPLLNVLGLDARDALSRIDQHQTRNPRGAYWNDCARAVVHNGAGQYEAAMEFAQRSSENHSEGAYGRALVEFVEAAVRCGEHERARAALELLVSRTQLGGTDWALGLEARCVALVSDDDAAESFYRQAIERLTRARTRPDLARAHLLYGEWLRRTGRRIDAREQLRTAHNLFVAIGMPVFAERARRELVATGATARKRTNDTRADLTPQESQIARLASEGLTNPEIAAQLFLSPRTVEYHLRKVFPKLGISSRRQLRKAVIPI